MGEQQAVANIIYSTQETPVELNGNVDIEKAAAEEVTNYFFSLLFVLFRCPQNEGDRMLIQFLLSHHFTTTTDP